ncbi:MAG TPA: HWE histidine kinase domain-containing protein [Steroidobacteraceae bacterium]|nr:HWE histidine kinase domain-containing protein [Steroidobacteraceae bacterium]
MDEDRYRSLFETIDAGFGILELIQDGRGRLTDLLFREVNASFLRHTGLTSVVDCSLRDVLPGLEQRWKEICSRVARTGAAESTESFVQAFDRWYRARHTRIGGADSRHVAVVLEDISERKHAELALRAAQERQEFLLHLNDTLRALDDPGEIQREACRMLREYLGTSGAPGKEGDLAEMLTAQFPPHHEFTPQEVVLLDETAERARTAVARARTETALRESEARLALVFMTLPIGIAVVTRGGETVMLNDEMRRFLPTGIVPSRDPSRQNRWRGQHADGRSIEPGDFPAARALRGESISPGIEMLYKQDDGREIWTLVGSAPLHDHDGHVSGAFVVVQDIDRLKRADARHATLLHDLQHRVRNALAMFCSIVTRTMQTGGSVEALGKVLEGRIESLARVQALLSRAAGVDLETLIRDELGERTEAAALAIFGPQLTLAPKAAEVLSLAIHELASNASKHGAIRHHGSVTVRWHVELRANRTQWLRLTWLEDGLKLEPGIRRRGLGTELIERRVPYELGGVAHVKLRAKGLRAELAFPLIAGETVVGDRPRADDAPRS